MVNHIWWWLYAHLVTLHHGGGDKRGCCNGGDCIPRPGNDNTLIYRRSISYILFTRSPLTDYISNLGLRGYFSAISY